MPDYVVLAEDTLTTTATSIDLTGISASYSHLELILNARQDRAQATVTRGYVRFNGLSSTIYGTIAQYTSNGSIGGYSHPPDNRDKVWSGLVVVQDSMPTNIFGITKMIFPNYANTSVARKGYLFQQGSGSSNSGTYWAMIGMGHATLSAAINRIELFSSDVSYPFLAGTSYYLAGWN